MQLLYEIIFLLTPDDRNGCILGYALRAVACIADKQLGAEFSLPGRCDAVRDHGYLLSGICRSGQRGQSDQSDQSGGNSRKVIVEHVLPSHRSTARVPVIVTTRWNHLKHAAFRLEAQDGAG